jgi:hypothetical protein
MKSGLSARGQREQRPLNSRNGTSNLSRRRGDCVIFCVRGAGCKTNDLGDEQLLLALINVVEIKRFPNQ